jgi:hypothetical protein
MSDIKVRVGQQNAIKIVSSISGSSGGQAYVAENVIGGIASVRALHVSGISTFVGISTFKNDVFIDGDLTIGDDLKFDSFIAREGIITGIATVNNLNVVGVSTFVGLSTFQDSVYIYGGLNYRSFSSFGMPYFNATGLIVSTSSPGSGIDYTNYIMTTDNAGIPAWSNAIDGGFY